MYILYIFPNLCLKVYYSNSFKQILEIFYVLSFPEAYKYIFIYIFICQIYKICKYKILSFQENGIFILCNF